MTDLSVLDSERIPSHLPDQSTELQTIRSASGGVQYGDQGHPSLAYSSKITEWIRVPADMPVNQPNKAKKLVPGALLNPMMAWGSLFESLFEVVDCGGQHELAELAVPRARVDSGA
ncbi:hypothetical protein ACFQMF_15940 [Halorubrum rutilum]|uniref:Uncharacterized protein n=1 Tax=Halorubrum rutilum TaxID=1364933 RepID=A0ABD6AP15_9EURY|nr:hypothetical protein [Halorubrum rutilum]